eukprot:TRINITY_DN6104_c0_g1_i1.p1 TRINITY_DN6104_c0_g1~~TRINITY_DN6104_c0_g1_i1.p1  ORF type:complete len:595 (+),score=163.97 TRINITY_DN6104_c0_g1_i1:147-1931(+)
MNATWAFLTDALDVTNIGFGAEKMGLLSPIGGGGPDEALEAAVSFEVPAALITSDGSLGAAAMQQVTEHIKQQLAQGARKIDEVEGRAKHAVMRLETEKREQDQRQQKRRIETGKLRQETKELQAAVAKCKSMLQVLPESLAQKRNQERQAVEEQGREVVKARLALAKDLPREVTNIGDDYSDAIDDRNSAEVNLIQQRNGDCMDGILRTAESDRGALELQYSQRLRERDVKRQHLEDELRQYRARVQQIQQQLQGDMVAAWDLVTTLSTLIDSMEEGVPVNFRSEIKRPTSASSVQRLGTAAVLDRRQRPDSASSIRSKTIEFPHETSLVKDIAKEMLDIRRQVSKHKKLPPLAPMPPPAQQSGGAVSSRARGGGSTGASQGPTTASEAAAADVIQTPQSSNRPGAAAGGTGPMAAELHVRYTWEAGEFARLFCDVGGGSDNTAAAASRPSSAATDRSEAATPLQRLDTVKLRALCAALRERIQMPPSQCKAERKQLQVDVARDLAGHARVGRIREVEKEISDYKAKLKTEEGRVSQLELAIQSCDRQKAAASPGGMMSQAAALAQQRHGSRSAPGFQGSTGSRPASASGVVG